MNIEKLLTYQAKDVEIIEIKALFKNIPQYNEVVKLGKRVGELQSEVQENDSKVIQTLSKSDDFFESIELLKEKIELLIEEIAHCETLDQIKPVSNEIGGLENEINRLELSIKDIERIKFLQENNIKKLTNLQLITKEFLNKRELLEVVINMFKEENIVPLQKELEELKKGLSNEEWLLYNKTREAVKTAPFICRYSDGFCGGCNKDIGAEVEKKLKQKGSYAICPECQRVVY